MKRLIIVFATLLMLTLLIGSTGVRADEGKVTVGAQAGEVGLAQDVGSTYGSALGVGAFFNYAPSDFLEFQLGWLASKHTSNNLNLSQNAFVADAIYNVDQFDVFTPYIEGGAEFVSHTQDVPGIAGGSNSTGFGLNVGAGAKIDLGKNLQTGLDFTYHNIFPVTVTTPGGVSVNVIQSYFTVLLRFGFSFGGGGSWLNR